MGKKKRQEESGPKVPGYIVTFSDMVTLLLTFFVMLLSISVTQEKELFREGQESFLQAMENLGLGVMMGRRQSANFITRKNKFFVDDPDQVVLMQTPDSDEERLRRLFEEMQQSMSTLKSQLQGDLQYQIADIKFAQGRWELNSGAERFLSSFASNLNEATSGQGKICIITFAPDVAGTADKWKVSARRAKVTADYLRTQLGDSEWVIHSWGTGDGGEWTQDSSIASSHSQVVLAVLR